MMKKIAAVCVLAGSLAVAGPASAHDRDGAVIGALIGGAVLGALVTSALNAPPVAYQAPAYQAPAYQPPAYQTPAYQPPDDDAPGYQQAQYQDGYAYGGQPGGYCYDRYQRAYVCGAPASGGYGYAEPAGW